MQLTIKWQKLKCHNIKCESKHTDLMSVTNILENNFIILLTKLTMQMLFNLVFLVWMLKKLLRRKPVHNF